MASGRRAPAPPPKFNGASLPAAQGQQQPPQQQREGSPPANGLNGAWCLSLHLLLWLAASLRRVLQGVGEGRPWWCSLGAGMWDGMPHQRISIVSAYG